MSDRISDLLAQVAALREAEMRKCEPSSNVPPFMKRAKRVFAEAVAESGGASEVAKLVPCNESNIRWQLDNPKRSPLLSVVYVLPEDEMDRIADDIKAAAAEKRAMRRAS